MNERIEALMIKASNGSCYDGPCEAQLSGDDIKKFAELIVEECIELNKTIPMRICGYTDDQNHPYYKGYQLGYYDGLVDVVNAIKEHFVVE